MSNTPERIFIGYDYQNGHKAHLWSRRVGDVEFIRADLVPRWVPVSKRLPGKNDAVPVSVENGRWSALRWIAIAHWVGEYWVFEDDMKVEGTVTHWLSNVPEIPK